MARPAHHVGRAQHDRVAAVAGGARGLGRLGELGHAHAPRAPRGAIPGGAVVVAAHRDAPVRQPRAQRIQRRRNPVGRIVQRLHQRQVRLGVAARLQRLAGQPLRPAPLGQSRVGQVIVEHHHRDAEPVDHRLGPPERLQIMRLEPHLQAQVHRHGGCHGGDGGKHLLGEVGPAHAALPRPELRQHRRRDPVGGKLGRHGDDARVPLAQRTAPGRHVPLEPVAMRVDDAGADFVAAQVDPPPGRAFRDAASGHRHRRVVPAVRPQDPRALQRHLNRHRSPRGTAPAGRPAAAPESTRSSPGPDRTAPLRGTAPSAP